MQITICAPRPRCANAASCYIRLGLSFVGVLASWLPSIGLEMPWVCRWSARRTLDDKRDTGKRVATLREDFFYAQQCQPPSNLGLLGCKRQASCGDPSLLKRRGREKSKHVHVTFCYIIDPLAAATPTCYDKRRTASTFCEPRNARIINAVTSFYRLLRDRPHLATPFFRYLPTLANRFFRTGRLFSCASTLQLVAGVMMMEINLFCFSLPLPPTSPRSQGGQKKNQSIRLTCAPPGCGGTTCNFLLTDQFHEHTISSHTCRAREQCPTWACL